MSSNPLPSVLIVCPSLADANNGNWHTALRWSRMLRGHCRTSVATDWSGDAHAALIALHARRSAPSIAAWARAFPDRPLVVVLTGTDLYRDILFDADAQRSLQFATRLVVLQDQGVHMLATAARAKCSVIYASARPLRAMPAPRVRLRAVQVCHLRDEKDPMTFLRAARRLADRGDIQFVQIGAALDETLAAAARRTQSECPQYRWFGGLARGVARQHMRHAQLLVSTSRVEGGSQVIVEAVQSGTAVIASRIPGNVGMLGRDHAGFFEVGDDEALARLIERARDDRGYLDALRRQSAERAALFDPAEEQRRLVRLIVSALATCGQHLP
jgi:putative glycosyltransferase (TIGR04348 family)